MRSEYISSSFSLRIKQQVYILLKYTHENLRKTINVQNHKTHKRHNKLFDMRRA